MEQKHDLTLTRVLDAPRSAVWKAWTTPELLMKWFTPEPVKTTDCEMDLRPGGVFRTEFLLPDGVEFTNVGIFLDVVEGEKLVFTDFFTPGYQPAIEPFMVAVISMTESSESDAKTNYHVLVRHRTEEDKLKHEKMGFYEGWGASITQLEALAKTL